MTLTNAIVTGAADSVGLATARAFCDRGKKVFICDVDGDKIDAVLSQHTGTMGGCVADVSDPESVAQLVRAAEGFFGAPTDILINTVGAGGPRGPIETLELKEWQRAFAVNVDSMLLTMAQVIPSMKQRRSGAIINFSSASTKTRLPNRTAYVASKYAVEGLTLNAARELGPFNIRCNAILPGPINNERMAGVLSAAAQEAGKSLEDYKSEFLDFVSSRSMIEPNEIAAMICHLCEDSSVNITGQSISVDGNLEWEG